MKPIKNVFAACDGSKKGYSVNGSESTLMLVGQKWDEDKAPVMSAILNHFDFFPKTHIVLLEIVALGNWKNNRNVKASDVNLLSMARSTDFFFKRTYIGMFLCFGSIIRCFQYFGTWSVNLWKIDSDEPPYLSEITVFESPLCLGILNDLPWGGSMEIFWNHTLHGLHGSQARTMSCLFHFILSR